MSVKRKCFLGEILKPYKKIYKPESKGSRPLPYIGLEHIQQDSLRLNGVGHSFDVASNKYYFSKGDILFGKLRPYFRKVIFPNFDGICSTDIWVLRVIDENKADKKFMFYFMASKEVIELATKTSTGTRMPRADWEFLSKMEINLPELGKQKKIAHILSSIDDKIELNNQINQDLEEMAQALFRSWFVDFEPFQDGELVESELGPIPKGWSVVELRKLVEISTKSIQPNDHPEVTYEHYSIPAFDSNKYPIFEAGSEIKSNKYVVNNNSILVSKLNPTTKRVWMPYALTSNPICSTEFINYQPTSKDKYFFVYGILDSEGFSKFLQRNTTGSTNSRQRVVPKETLRYKIAMPNNEEIISKYCELAKGIFYKFKLNFEEIQELQSLRDTLLPKLMSGEIRV